jgi:hypothetical protein
MSNDDSEEDRKARIDLLKRKIEEMTGEKPVSFGSGRCSPELKEKFWEYVLAFEEGQHSLLFDTLINGGLSLPAPDELNDVDLTGKLFMPWRYSEFFCITQIISMIANSMRTYGMIPYGKKVLFNPRIRIMLFILISLAVEVKRMCSFF